MVVLGLDLSLTSTGYSVNGNTGVISSNKRGPSRLIEICDAIEKIIDDNNVDLVSIEGYSYSSRNSQSHAIGELGGVVRVMLHTKQITYVEIPPTCRAKFATGKGNASKNEVISTVSAKTGIVWKNPGADDQCDAWVLEEMTLTKAGQARYDWPRASEEALAKVDWPDSVLDERGKN